MHSSVSSVINLLLKVDLKYKIFAHVEPIACKFHVTNHVLFDVASGPQEVILLNKY